MKRILISSVLALALAGTTAFAAQNKNAPKKPAAKPKNAAAATMSDTGAKKPVRRHRRRAAKKNGNMGGETTMRKAKNKNSK